MADYDLAIIGGGINGCGVARDAAGRGLSVFLAEQGDLASATSSASTKLIHGGLRYLENFHFRLVRESLRERDHLLTLAPHLVRPVRFVMPHVRGMRSAWTLRAGFALYDWFGADERLPRTRALDLADDPAGAPLKSGFGLGFEYSDCIADDARLVIANAIDAREKGAEIRTRTRCAAARREDGRWHLVVQSGGKRETITARALVNATGPWVARVIETVVRRRPGGNARLVKGSHIVLPRLHAHDRAYVLQNDDGRFVFAVPFADDFTLVGTTEIEVSGDAGEVAASSDEILYLCRAASAFFRAQVKPSKVKWTYAGVRTLIDDGSSKPSRPGPPASLCRAAISGRAALMGWSTNCAAFIHTLPRRTRGGLRAPMERAPGAFSAAPSGMRILARESSAICISRSSTTCAGTNGLRRWRTCFGGEPSSALSPPQAKLRRCTPRWPPANPRQSSPVDWSRG
jgi:glycerol-3-phosphate dehydrogenase